MYVYTALCYDIPNYIIKCNLSHVDTIYTFSKRHTYRQPYQLFCLIDLGGYNLIITEEQEDQ